jgi:ABC-2 type transport system ATP-binding protein/lipopolysaccharide transport system ATP-binding protein
MPEIRLQNVCVDLPLYNSKGRSIKSAILAQTVGGHAVDRRDRSVVVIQALSDVTLHIEHGARIALIGANGAGKTTLLRVAARIYPPTRGIVDIAGRVACLTDLNVGMDTEATGFENIRMRGRLLGLSTRQIAELVPSVAEFTELGEYLQLPIRCYSQGMLLRLAFGMSTGIQPDILLLDEIIGVGDQAFEQKAKERISKLIDSASILMLASHSPSVIRMFCSSAIWLAHGQVMAFGPVDEILERYSASLNMAAAGEPLAVK